MKVFITILQFLIIFYVTKAENERKWMEIGKELYLVETKSEYTWKQAVTECQKEHSTIISPKGDYDYARLKNAIKHNFKNYSSFWTDTQVKWTNIFHELGLGKDKNNRKKCNKFDSTFKFQPEECDKQIGFICQKPLLNGFSSFYSKEKVYLVQPDHQFSCEQAYDECERRHMLLLPLKDYNNYELLRDYIFINYGSAPSFWFGFNNETHYNCITPNRGQPLYKTSKLGFICYQNYLKNSTLSTRHLVLIIFLALVSFVAISVYLIARCCCVKKTEIYYTPDSYCYPQDMKVTEIK